MGSAAAEKIPRADESEGPQAAIEIKIKTLDSQTYTLKVDKQVIALAPFSWFCFDFRYASLLHFLPMMT